MTMTSETARAGREWLARWNPEDEASWDRALAWRTLWITTFALTMCFVAWFLPSALVPKLNALGFGFTKDQLYWMAAMPGLSGGALRVLWMILPPIMGTRKMVTITSAMLLIPLVGWAVAIQSNSTPYWALMALAFLAGIGGGAFSGFMPSTSYFFPRRMSGTALGLQAGIGNFGVSLVQLLTPMLVGFAMVGGPQMLAVPGKASKEVWFQNSGYTWVPFVLVAIALSWWFLKSVPVTANIKQQFDIFRNTDTWLMTYLYIMTFGTFSGLSAQFALLTSNLYGSGNAKIVRGVGAAAKVLVTGYSVPDPVTFVFWGALVGAASRVVFSPLTDRMGGAKWTLISGLGLIASIAYTIPALTPDLTTAASLHADFLRFFWGMMAIFLFTGIGNASTFKQMPMIFERRQAGGVIGWTSAIAAFGPFLFGVGLTLIGPVAFYIIGVLWAVGGVVITWLRYTRKGAARPS